jgi:tRNA pseudouridine38-40 synthase
LRRTSARGLTRSEERERWAQNWKLTLEYDGSKYSGWAEQNNARTVMGAVREALENVFRQPVDFAGAGRTDAGVHARGQVAHVRLERAAALPPTTLLRELNTALPADVAAPSLEAAPLSFHARHDATSRLYTYQIARRKTAFDKKFVWWIKEELNVAAMRDAASALVGRHDFRHFQAIDPGRAKESSIVVVERATLVEADQGGLLLFQIEASHFLWRMVRRVTGTLARVGKGEVSLADLRGLLREPTTEHDVAAWTAPASGLFLESVRYRRAQADHAQSQTRT